MTGSQLRRFLESRGVSQSAAARALGIDPRTMRRYILGESRVPRVVDLALRYVISKKGKQS